MVSLTDAERELSQTIAEGTGHWIEGSGAFAGFRSARRGASVSLGHLEGVVEHHPADMVVTVRGGTRMAELQSILAKSRQCLPLLLPEGFPNGTVGGGIGMAIPHPLESKWGSWRDWVLGLKLLLADGTVVKCGSRAVKNVAGYDIQKLIVGSRGSLAIVLEATLRVAPTSALTMPDSLAIGKSGALKCVHRVLRSDFPSAFEASKQMILFACPDTGTLWLAGDPERRFEGDWIMNSGQGEANVGIRSRDQVRLMLRAKEIFDPLHKLNPKEWEFI